MLGFHWLWLILSTLTNVLWQEWFTEVEPRRSTVLTLLTNAKPNKHCLVTFDKVFVDHQRWQTEAKLSWISSSQFRYIFFLLCKIFWRNFSVTEKQTWKFLYIVFFSFFVESMLWHTSIFSSSRRVWGEEETSLIQIDLLTEDFHHQATGNWYAQSVVNEQWLSS